MPDITGVIVVWFLVGKFQPQLVDRSQLSHAIAGVSAIAVYTVATVWTMEMLSGKWKTVFGFIIGFAWPLARYVTMTMLGFAYLG